MAWGVVLARLLPTVVLADEVHNINGIEIPHAS